MDEDYRQMDLQDAWNVYTTEADQGSATYNKIRFGLKIKFDIYDFLYGMIQVNYKVHHNLVRLGRTDIERDKFFTEIEDRRRICVDWLEKNMKEESPYKAMEMVGVKRE